MNQGKAPVIESIYRKADAYQRLGDFYMAIKLFKKIIRIDPLWELPYTQLSQIYHELQDWKATLHYSEQAVLRSSNPQQELWHCQGIAATALKRWQLARKAWNQLGYEFRDSNQELRLDMGAACLRLDFYQHYQAIVWAKLRDPARAEIMSIPPPASGYCFRDVVLIDSHACGLRIVRKKRVPVYRALQVLKQGHFHTFEVWLMNTDLQEIDLLASLCQQADIGFDNWSAGSRQMIGRARRSNPEYYGQPGMSGNANDPKQVALAALREDDVLEVMHQWELITLGTWAMASRQG